MSSSWQITLNQFSLGLNVKSALAWSGGRHQSLLCQLCKHWEGKECEDQEQEGTHNVDRSELRNNAVNAQLLEDPDARHVELG